MLEEIKALVNKQSVSLLFIKPINSNVFTDYSSEILFKRYIVQNSEIIAKLRT